MLLLSVLLGFWRFELITFFYHLVLLIGFLCYLPWLLLRRKQGPSIKERLGYIPKIKKRKPFLIWIHAVSLGETKAVAPLASMLKETYGSDVQFVVSSGTATARAEVKKVIPFADDTLYLPLDFSWIMDPLIKEAQPDLVLISETDLWLNFLSVCKKYGAQLMIVNGKMSERSCSRYATFAWWSQRVFSQFDHICTQSRHYRDRYRFIGVHKEKISVTGNLKLDHVYPVAPDLQEWKASLGLVDDDQILVIGSTHEPEERWFLEILDGLWKDFPRLKVLLVPRHPERFDSVANLIFESGQPFKRYTQNKTEEFRILLVDTMGILKKCYQIADCAIVAGSYVEHVGGHNILEPSEYGVPVIFGPCMHTQPELLELCLSYEAGLQVPMQELSGILRSLLTDENMRRGIGENGLQLIREHQGATARTLKIIKELLPKRASSDILDAYKVTAGWSRG